MEGQIYQCPGCFTTIPAGAIDFKLRRGVCPSCGNLVILTRKSLNRSEGVVHDLENAVRFFLDNNYESAKRYAESALSVAVDNAPALFIIAYYSAYVAETKTRNHLNKFFFETLPDLDCDEEEVEMLKKLFLKTILHLFEYEKSILKKMYSTQNGKDLAEFVEAFCPYLITKRGSIDWLDGEMADVYSQISADADVPKTWFALYTAISKNPDSPEIGDTYYLKTKAQRFYVEFVLRIEKVFSHIRTDALKAKFNGAFASIKQKIQTKMKSNGGVA